MCGGAATGNAGSVITHDAATADFHGAAGNSLTCAALGHSAPAARQRGGADDGEDGVRLT